MTKEEIEYIKGNLKWPIGIEYISSFLFVFLPLLFVYFGMKDLIVGKSIHSDFELYTFILIGSLTFLWILSRIQSERKFKKLKLDKEHNINEIDQKLSPFLWITLESGKNKRVYLDKVCLFSYGVYVTIIQLDEKTLLINTKPFGRQPFTFNRDKVNYQRIKTMLLSSTTANN